MSDHHVDDSTSPEPTGRHSSGPLDLDLLFRAMRWETFALLGLLIVLAAIVS